ncbi:MAG: type IVB secretion system protein IcmH/DotU [Parashewanella sp.]
MSGLFNDEPTVVIERTDSKVEEQLNTDEVVNLDLNGTEQIIEHLEVYGNALINAVTELLGILVTIPRQGAPVDIDRFRQRLIFSIGNFQKKGAHLDYYPSVIEKSCFVLCAAFDEAILYTSWGEKAHWENHSLLSKTFSERNGGEVFFQLLDKACIQPAKLVDFIELQYIILMLGFKGRYRHRDEAELHEIKSNVYNVLRNYRTDSPLPKPETPEVPIAKEPWRMWSMKKLAALAGLLIVSGYVFSEYWYYNQSQNLVNQSQLVDKIPLKNRGIALAEPTDAEEQTPANAIVESMMHNQMNAINWEVLLAVFSTSSDANQLETVLNKAGYHTVVKNTEHGIELVSTAGNDLAAIRKLKSELNIKFGLHATIRKAQQ